VIDVVDRQELVSEVSAALFKGSGALFVGAGFSIEADTPGWGNLLGERVQRLGVSPADVPDWPLMAQFLINDNRGNRDELLNFICGRLQGEESGSRYHDALARMNLSTIWTTNWDRQIEVRLERAEIPIEVQRADDETSAHSASGAVQVMKMHGCITAPKSMVVTRSDYEDYLTTHPGMVRRLELDLSTRTMLFAGYGLEDPDLQNALVQARRITRARQHYIVLKKEAGDPATLKWQSLWIEDLKRLGIRSLLIDDYDGLASILDEIALRSRGATVFVTGSHERTEAPLALELGRLLATESDVTLMDGQQSGGIGYFVRSAFMAAAAQTRADIASRVRMYANPYHGETALENDRMMLPVLRKWRRPLLRATSVIVAFDGGMGSREEIELARELGCVIVPVPEAADGLARELLEDAEIGGELERRVPGYVRAAETGIPSSDTILSCIKSLLGSVG